MEQAVQKGPDARRTILKERGVLTVRRSDEGIVERSRWAFFNGLLGRLFPVGSFSVTIPDSFSPLADREGEITQDRFDVSLPEPVELLGRQNGQGNLWYR